MIYGIYQRYLLWCLGKEGEKLDRIGERIKSVIYFAIGHRRILNTSELYPGLMHLLIFVGFIVPLSMTVLAMLESSLSLPPFLQSIYPYVALILDISGLLALIGILLALVRRYIVRPERLDNRPDDAISLVGVLAIVIVGFLIAGLRITITEPDWMFFSPTALAVSWYIKTFSIHEATLAIIHKWIWKVHCLLVVLFVSYVAYSKLLHIITSTLNIFLRNLGPVGAIRVITDFETAETFGVSNLEEFSRTQLINLDACTRCGRCQDNCPAHLSEKPLSPKKLIQDLKVHLEEKGKILLSTNIQTDGGTPSLIGEVVSEDTLWACTACLNCHEQCPVFIPTFDKTIEMRRYLVLMESRFPSEVQLVFRNMENNSNPWGVGKHLRAEWCKDLGVKTLAEDPEVDILYFPGCAGAFDDRNKKVAIAMVKLLQKAGVKFAILGTEEGCCGDSARRIGNEYLYKTLVDVNIEVLKTYNVKKILTTCPHCYNTLKNEYPQFGGNYELIHQTEFLNSLIEQKKLRFNNGNPVTVTYHDSCILGRYNQIYDQPRNILTSIPGIILKEMERTRNRSFCCGAGGGRMWMEEHLGKRINEMRIDQALELKPDVIATACPYCLTMLEDGVKAKGLEEQVKTLDIAELLEKAITD
jgi:Fe-S oxidoreductase/nitrate reductase gamma subunit